MPTAHGYDVMRNVILYALNEYTYVMPGWNPTIPSKVLAYYKKATKGSVEGEAGKPVREVSKVTNDNIAELEVMMTKTCIEYIERYAKQDKPFFMSINFAKNHQLPKPFL